MHLSADLEAFGLPGALQVVDLSAVLVADPMNDLVGALQARPWPVRGDQLPMVLAQVQRWPLVVAVPAADELAGVRQGSPAGDPASEPVGDDRVLVGAPEVDRLEVQG